MTARPRLHRPEDARALARPIRLFVDDFKASEAAPEGAAAAVQQFLEAALGLYPLVPLETQIQSMIGNLRCIVADLHCEVTVGYNPRRRSGRNSPSLTGRPWSARWVSRHGGANDIMSRTVITAVLMIPQAELPSR